jgi:hypothetical protein
MLLASVVLTLPLTLAACGGVESPGKRLATAADKSTEAGPVRMQVEGSFSNAGTSTPFAFDGIFNGVVAKFTFGKADVGAAGEQAYDTIITEENGHAILYSRIEPGHGFPEGKTWTKVDYTVAMGEAGISGAGLQDTSSGLLGAASGSPSRMLSLLRDAGSVTEVEGGTDDSDQTTHYRATVDLREAIENGGLPFVAIFGLFEKHAGAMPVDVWVGVDDGYVHRLTLGAEGTAKDPDAGFEMTITLSGWGSLDAIELPHPEEVFEATDLALGN